MNYETGFAREDFKNYIATEYSLNYIATEYNLEFSKSMEIMDNIISYAINNINFSKDQLAYFIENIFGIEFNEVAGFCADEILTSYGQQEKQKFLSEHIEYDDSEKWTEEKLCEALEADSGLTNIYSSVCEGNDKNQRFICTLIIEDMGDEELQILCKIVKEEKNENDTWQQIYDKKYYCEDEAYKNISIKDFLLLNRNDYSIFFKHAIAFSESGKEQLYFPPRSAGNYKVYNTKETYLKMIGDEFENNR